MDYSTILQLADSTLRLSTPLLFACLAGLYSERAGVFDIGLEGKMLMAAFVAAAFAHTPPNTVMGWVGLPGVGPWGDSGQVMFGLLFGVIAAVLMALIHGLASITFRGNQIISGVAINFLASGLTVLIGQIWFRQGGQTPALTGTGRFEAVTLPFTEQLSGIPYVGQLYADVISGHNILVYIAILLVPITWWILFRTRFGLRLRAVGENPGAVDTAGINVPRMRYKAVIICGILCGLAGAYLSTAMAAGFGREMAAGRGFIALAALIFAKWRPGPALFACLLFGLLEAISIRFQSVEMSAYVGAALLLGVVLLFVLPRLWIGLAAGAVVVGAAVGVSREGLLPEATFALPVQFMQALPYILTVIILAGFVGKAIPPKAGGQPYVKER